jgi:ribose transport system permease protein
MNGTSDGRVTWRATIVTAPKSGPRLLQDRPLLALAALLLLLTSLVEVLSPGSVRLDWVVATLVFAAPLGIIAAGQTLVIITGGIDLSVGTVATTSLYVMATEVPHGVPQAILLGLGVGALVGLLNGLGVAIFKVQPLIMTLGVSLVTEGVLNVYAEHTVIAGAVPVVPSFIRGLGASRIVGVIPVSLILWTLLAIVIEVGLRRSGYGRLLYAIGTNRTACRLSGVRIWQVLLVTYTITGLLSGVGGILLSGATGVADRGLVEPYLLPSVAAVVIGGTSIFGGAGGYSGTIIGALILTILAGLLTVLNAPAATEQILNGGLILIVTAAFARVVSERS